MFHRLQLRGPPDRVYLDNDIRFWIISLWIAISERCESQPFKNLQNIPCENNLSLSPDVLIDRATSDAKASKIFIIGICFDYCKHQYLQ